jgi:hypothetical protein
VRERRHFLFPLTFPVEKQFNFIQIRVYPDRDRLAFALLPIPVRK